ncbi:MAG: helix-turn-helix domain-containing protein [Gammaproteobacteria bacterium]|nr:helix-turn-helix domain-containing protein [Gammaproteobacteria bacterium]
MTEPAASGESPSAEFGLLFRTAREATGMTPDEVADALHLDVAVVFAIEEGRFADLPMRPYARGYVRNYARVLGLDADELARRFDAADAGRPEPSVVVPRHRVTPKSELALRPLALGYAAIVAVLLIALGAVLWTAWRVQDWQFPFLADDVVEPPAAEPATESPAGRPNVSPWPIVTDGAAEDGAADGGSEVATADQEPITPALAVADEPVASAALPAEPQAQTGEHDEARSFASDGVADGVPASADGTTAVSGVVGELTVVFDDESWVSVDDATGRQLFGDLGRNGRTITVAGQVPLSILVGNALAVRVEFDGESVDLGPFTRENNVARFELGGG